MLLVLKLSILFGAVRSSPFRAVCALFSNSAFSFERFAPLISLSSGFAPCSHIPKSFSSDLLLVLKFSRLFRAVCPLFSKSLVSFERLDICSNFSSLFQSGSSGLLLSLLVSSALSSGLLVVFKHYRFCRSSLVCFKRFAGCSQLH